MILVFLRMLWSFWWSLGVLVILMKFEGNMVIFVVLGVFWYFPKV